MTDNIEIGKFSPKPDIRTAFGNIAIQDPNELKTSLAAGSSALRGVSLKDGEEAVDRAIDVFCSEETRQRVFLLHSLASWLYPDTADLKNIIEVCSAGATAAPLAFPDTQVLSVDFDKDHFLTNTTNTLPPDIFRALGMRKHIESWGKGDKQEQERKLHIIQSALPNFHPIVADARDLDVSTGLIDLALIHNHPVEEDILESVSRVIKPGGVIIASTNVYDKPDTPSHYAAGTYNFTLGKDCLYYGDMERASQRFGLYQLRIPEEIQKYEHLGVISEGVSSPVDAGFVFQVFRKGLENQIPAGQ